MDCGLQARTKQFIEFGLKISFTPCYFFKNTCKLFHIKSQIRTIIQYSAEVNEIQRGCGDVQQVTRKGIIQSKIV